jgi:hypothetical protein
LPGKNSSGRGNSPFSDSPKEVYHEAYDVVLGTRPSLHANVSAVDDLRRDDQDRHGSYSEELTEDPNPGGVGKKNAFAGVKNNKT